MKEPKDPRSTYRRRARAILLRLVEQGDLLYVCKQCGLDPKVYPAVVLQANHVNKLWRDCDPANLEWLCPSCHKIKDSKTAAGQVIVEDFGYGNY